LNQATPATPITSTLATPTATPPPTPSPSSTATSSLAGSASAGRDAITVLYDNVAYDGRLRTDWGFSALVEYRGETVLFDTGADGKILLANMGVLGIEPARVRQVVLSHAHSDHIGGLRDFLGVSSKPPVFLLAAFGSATIRGVRASTEAIETSAGMEIAPGIFTTGRVAGTISEQALAIRTPEGLVVITGCAHPGVDRMVKAAVDLAGEPAVMVVGGFHLGDASRAEIAAELAALRELGVERVAPSHCTGPAATGMFADEFGDGFIRSGAGAVISLEG
jgi:7,8-dihydropterin-6-yl-methyl-4-(beta-D-ribofuranosyl)aminobenzene 5'-phosphate synthase